MNDQTAVTALSSSDLAAKLRERIRSTLGELIPDEQWTALLKAEVDRFISPPRMDSYGQWRRQIQGDLGELVYDELRKEVARRSLEYFDSDEWKMKIGPSGELSMGKKLEEALAERGKQAMLELLGRVIQGIGSPLRNAVQSIVTDIATRGT